jgi:hypothetical protein
MPPQENLMATETLPPDDIEFEPASTPTDDALKGVAALAERQRALEDRIAAATAALRRDLDEYRRLTEGDLPEALAAVGLRSFELSWGGKVGVETRYIGGKLVDREGLDYVIANGGAALIETALHLSFPLEESQLAQEFYDLVRRHPRANSIEAKIERSVHNARIGSFAKELVEAGRDPPLEKLNVYRRNRAKLTVRGRKLKSVEIKSAFVMDGAANPGEGN